LAVKLVPGLGVPAKVGPTSSAANLAEIAEHVQVSNLAPKPGENTSHARPTMLANVSSFAENVQEAWNALAPGAAVGAFGKLPESAKQDFMEWQGMVAAVALSNIYSGMGLNLSVDPMVLNGAGNAAVKCVLLEMEKDADYKDAVHGKQGTLYYICQNQKPFAIFHPKIGLCPMKNYDPAIFDGVLPWYEKDAKNCHAGWKSILGLDPFCLQRVAWWAGANNLIAYQTYLLGKLGAVPGLPAALAVKGAVANASSINSDWPGKGNSFGTAMMAYLDLAGNACPIPELFLDTMAISSIGAEKNNRMVYNTAAGEKPIFFQNDGGKLNAYAPVPPFKKSMMDLLSICSLQTIDFTANWDGKGLLSGVTVVVIFDTPSGSLKMHRTYSYDKLRLVQMPYLMLWPFVPMPAGMSLWKSFYATWHDQTQGLDDRPIGSNGKPISIATNKLGYDWGTQGVTHTVYRPTASEQAWPVCVGDAPFRYAVLTSTDVVSGAVEEIGLVFMPKYPEYPATAGKSVTVPVTLAVDFGTTSTVCAMSSPMFVGKTDITLPFMDYSRCVTCEDDTARETVNTMHWLGSKEGGPAWQWDQKLFSVAQLFNQSPAKIILGKLPMAAQQEYYVDGRLFLVSGDALVALANAVTDADPLLTQQIMNDMKFNHGSDNKNYFAASIFLAGIYQYAILYLLKEKFVPEEGTSFVDLRVSYPNDVTLDALQQNWGYARTILNKVMDPSLTAPITAPTYYTEATAATAYQLINAPETVTNALVSLDLGGGTTDISISNKAQYPNDVRNLSIRYAGREIMVSSLVEFYRKLNPALPAIVSDSDFSNLWPEGDLEAAKLYGHFNKLCSPVDEKGKPIPPKISFLHGLTNNSTLRMSVEMLLAKGMNMGQATDLNATNLPRQLIAMKLIMLMQVVARTVRENIELWKDPIIKTFNLVGKNLEINLSVSGTGAQMLQYVFDCNMTDLEDLKTPAALDMNSKMAQCLNLMNTIFYEKLMDILPDGVCTSLKIYVDRDVAKKQNVSYGMLNPAIAGLKPKQPAPGAGGLVPGFPALAGAAGKMTPAQRAIETAKRQTELHAYSVDELDAYINGQKDGEGAVVKHGVMDYWKWYEQIFFPAPANTNRGLGHTVDAMSSLGEQANYLPYFTNAKMTVAQNRAAYMIEPEQLPYLDLLTGMYMVEELLDWEIAQRQ